MSEPAHTVAAFDFDGTLTRRDTLLPFLVDVAGPARVARAMALDAPRLARMALGRADRDAAKSDLVARVLAGYPYADVAARGRAYALRVVERGLRPSTLARLRWHVREGHDVVIVSAALDAYLHEVARLLGVATVLCTTLEVDTGGRITGRLEGGNCRGPEKIARLANHLDGARVRLWAYGDSHGDAELLAAADHPVRVTRSGRLRDGER
jgi:phosphatidylglycerophosphatase C